jgi:antitoxin component YwqK of YwqJK toxin-antitoxin module
MKATLLALFVALLMVGCEESPNPSVSVDSTDPLETRVVPEVTNPPKGFDLDHKETLKDILEEAIDIVNLEWVDKHGERLTADDYLRDPFKARKSGIRSDSLRYEHNEQKPFTGWAKQMHENGQVKELKQYKEGKLDGLESRWYENGQKKGELHWKDGKKDGLWTSWYENGQKRQEGNHKEGKKDGVHTKWWSDGQKQVQEKFVLGTSQGVSTAWHPNGEKMSEYLIQDGKIVDGVYTVRNEDGTKYKITYKEGGRVSQELITTPNP